MVEKLQPSKRCYSVKVSRFIVDIHDKTACDFAGPLFCKTSGEDPSNKCYIALFTCCPTRSVHLELVADPYS